MEKHITTEAKTDSIEPITKWMKLAKESLVLIGFIVTGTLLYANITNSLESLREANKERITEITALKDSQQRVSDSLSGKLDIISEHQSEQALALTRIATQLEMRAQMPQEFQRPSHK